MATDESYYEKNARYERENKINVTELIRLSNAVKSSGGYISAKLHFRTTERHDDATIIMDNIDKLFIEIFHHYSYEKNKDYESKIKDLTTQIMYVINNYNWHVDIKKYPPLYDPTRTWKQWWMGDPLDKNPPPESHGGTIRVRKSVRKCVRKIRTGRGKSRRRSRSGGK